MNMNIVTQQYGYIKKQCSLFNSVTHLLIMSVGVCGVGMVEGGVCVGGVVCGCGYSGGRYVWVWI